MADTETPGTTSREQRYRPGPNKRARPSGGHRWVRFFVVVRLPLPTQLANTFSLRHVSVPPDIPIGTVGCSSSALNVNRHYEKLGLHV